MISKGAAPGAPTAAASTSKSKSETADVQDGKNAAAVNDTAPKMTDGCGAAAKTGKTTGASGDGAVKKLREPWTQNQQTIFEWALKQYPKGTEARWDKVAEHIPGKSKVI